MERTHVPDHNSSEREDDERYEDALDGISDESERLGWEDCMV